MKEKISDTQDTVSPGFRLSTHMRQDRTTASGSMKVEMEMVDSADDQTCQSHWASEIQGQGTSHWDYSLTKGIGISHSQGCVCVCVSCQLCPTLWDPMDCSPPSSSVHGILQVGILEWVAISFSRWSFWPRDWTQISCIEADALPSELLGKPRWLAVKNPPANAGDMRLGLDPWIGKMPWKRAWQPTPVVLPGESHGQRSLVG